MQRLNAALAGARGAREPAAEPDGRKYGRLGVTVEDMPPVVAAQLGLLRGEGVAVVSVEDGSPADKAGLQKHDIIVKVDDQFILAAEQFRKLIAYTEPGTRTQIGLIRRTKGQTAPVTLGETTVPPTSGGAALPFAWGGGWPQWLRDKAVEMPPAK